MYFLSIFLSPIVLINRNRTSNNGNCDIENRSNSIVSIEQIRHIYNISKLVHFYESPNISTLDKLHRIEEMDENFAGFHISNGGLFNRYEDFEKIFTHFFLF